MSEPRSRASLMMRLMGAESGATIAMTRPATTMLPNPTLINFGPALFNILDLLAQALQFAFDGDDRARDLHVVGLRPDRVGLAPHLLQQELQFPAQRAVGGGEVEGELLGVAAQPRQLLGDVAALGEDDDLGGQALFVHGDVAEQFADAGP